MIDDFTPPSLGSIFCSFLFLGYMHVNGENINIHICRVFMACLCSKCRQKLIKGDNANVATAQLPRPLIACHTWMGIYGIWVDVYNTKGKSLRRELQKIPALRRCQQLKVAINLTRSCVFVPQLCSSCCRWLVFVNGKQLHWHWNGNYSARGDSWMCRCIWKIYFGWMRWKVNSGDINRFEYERNIIF